MSLYHAGALIMGILMGQMISVTEIDFAFPPGCDIATLCASILAVAPRKALNRSVNKPNPLI
jgi:hypothetical protein